MKILFLIFILMSAIIIQSCGTPQVIKSLSLEQLNAQKTSRDSLISYFGIMEQVITNQIKVFKAEEDRDLQKQISIFQQQYNLAINKAEANKAALLDELTKKVKEATENSNSTKQTYDKYLSDLKNKHKEILAVLANMVIAQETLNSFIQLEKVDEVFGKEIFLALGTDQEKVKKYGDEINNILTNLKALKGE